MRESGVFPAITEEERNSVFEFRYGIYVEEMGRYRDVADHTSRRLIEDIDKDSRLYMALKSGQAGWDNAVKLGTRCTLCGTTDRAI